MAARVADTIADWKEMPGAVGIRIMAAAGPLVAPDDPGVNRVLAVAAQHALGIRPPILGRNLTWERAPLCLGTRPTAASGFCQRN